MLSFAMDIPSQVVSWTNIFQCKDNITLHENGNVKIKYERKKLCKHYLCRNKSNIDTVRWMPGVCHEDICCLDMRWV